MCYRTATKGLMEEGLQTWGVGLLKTAANTDAKSRCRGVIKNPMREHLEAEPSRAQGKPRPGRGTGAKFGAPRRGPVRQWAR